MTDPEHDSTDEPQPDETLTDVELRGALESILLVVDSPATVDQLVSATGCDRARIEALLTRIATDFTARGSGIDLRFVGDGWRFYTRTEFAPYVERLLLDGARSKLTRAALETLAVIAYRQPVTRARVGAVRGVNVDGVMRTLLARGLIAEAGPDPDSGATQYVTTDMFLERLGLSSLGDLPELAPLLPGVDMIDDINDSMDSDPRVLRAQRRPEADPNPTTEFGTETDE